MGKRKRSDKEEHLARKMKKLAKKMEKVRRQRRRSFSTSSDHSESSEEFDHYKRPRRSATPEDQQDYTSEQEALHSKEAPQEGNPVQSADTGDGMNTEPVQELDPVILSILGDEPTKDEVFSPEIHRDLASRWESILMNELKEETKKDILESLKIPENLKCVQAPILNAEIKAAVSEASVKRDSILTEKQKIIEYIISGVAKVVSSMLSAGREEDNENLKMLSDAGRLLCHVHFTETQTRENFLLACLNKEVKDTIKDTKRDQSLFGRELPEKLKSMKAISMAGAELRPAAPKPKPQPRGRPTEATTTSQTALNWRGPPPYPAPRRGGTARGSSMAGGRRQPPPTRRPPPPPPPQDRQASRHRTSYRTYHR